MVALPGGAGLHLFIVNIRSIFKLDELGLEVMRIAVPTSLALAADPLASLVDTAFIGRSGSVDIAAVGVSIAIFNQVSKICIYPLVSVTTSFVAEEDAMISKCTGESSAHPDEKANCPVDQERTSNVPLPVGHDDIPMGQSNGIPNSKKTCCRRKFIPSVTSALIVGLLLGLLQALFLTLAAKILLRLMGVKVDSPMLVPALRYLRIRSLGAPAILLSLAMLVGDATNIILDPILMFVCHMGVTGAAVAHVASQYLITTILIIRLLNKVCIVPPSLKSLKLTRYLQCGVLLVVRVVAVTSCVTLASSLAARHGPTIMAAFQICSQLWLATSLLADGLAVAAQTLLASAFANNDLDKVVAATSRVLQLSIVLGMGLTLVLGVAMRFASRVFTNETDVIYVIYKGIPFVAGLQTMNCLPFVLDGINFGASDYSYSAYSMVVVSSISIPCLVYLSVHKGFIGIWVALTIYMTLRTIASILRMVAAKGPWLFLGR